MRRSFSFGNRSREKSQRAGIEGVRSIETSPQQSLATVEAGGTAVRRSLSFGKLGKLPFAFRKAGTSDEGADRLYSHETGSSVNHAASLFRSPSISPPQTSASVLSVAQDGDSALVAVLAQLQRNPDMAKTLMQNEELYNSLLQQVEDAGEDPAPIVNAIQAAITADQRSDHNNEDHFDGTEMAEARLEAERRLSNALDEVDAAEELARRLSNALDVADAAEALAQAYAEAEGEADLMAAQSGAGLGVGFPALAVARDTVETYTSGQAQELGRTVTEATNAQAVERSPIPEVLMAKTNEMADEAAMLTVADLQQGDEMQEEMGVEGGETDWEVAELDETNDGGEAEAVPVMDASSAVEASSAVAAEVVAQVDIAVAAEMGVEMQALQEAEANFGAGVATHAMCTAVASQADDSAHGVQSKRTAEAALAIVHDVTAELGVRKATMESRAAEVAKTMAVVTDAVATPEVLITANATEQMYQAQGVSDGKASSMAVDVSRDDATNQITPIVLDGRNSATRKDLLDGLDEVKANIAAASVRADAESRAARAHVRATVAANRVAAQAASMGAADTANAVSTEGTMGSSSSAAATQEHLLTEFNVKYPVAGITTVASDADEHGPASRLYKIDGQGVREAASRFLCALRKAPIRAAQQLALILAAGDEEAISHGVRLMKAVLKARAGGFGALATLCAKMAAIAPVQLSSTQRHAFVCAIREVMASSAELVAKWAELPDVTRTLQATINDELQALHLGGGVRLARAGPLSHVKLEVASWARPR